MRGLLVLYRWLLHAYPRAFRDTYGRDMTLVFRDRCRAVRAREGRTALVLSVAGACVDLLSGGLAERLHAARTAMRAQAIPSSPQSSRRRGDSMWQTIRQDLRYAITSATRQPAFALTVVLIFALGIGATSAIFSVVDAVLLKPLPYRDPGRLVSVLVTTPQKAYARIPVAPANLPDLQARTKGFATLAGFSPSWEMRLTGAGDPAEVYGQYVSAGLFDLLGVGPARGRAFLPEEDQPHGPRVVVVSASFWQQHFGPSAPLAGQTIQLDLQPYTIVGIMPAGFRLPLQASIVNERAGNAEFWLPFALNPYVASRRIPVMNVVGRLAAGVPLARAQSELDAVAAGLAHDVPTSRGQGLAAVPLQQEVVGHVETTLLVLFGAVAFLALIACANVANLLLARGINRSRELTMRFALGASRTRLVQQLLVESALDAAIGGLFGLLVAYGAVQALPGLDLPQLPHVTAIAVDGRVVAFTLGLAALTALLAGLAPALHATGDVALGSLKEGARTVTGPGRRLRNGLVLGEIAVALMLLVGGGLLLRSFWDLTHVNPGFRTARLVELPVSPTPSRFDTAERRRAYMTDLLGRLDGLPGIDAAAAVNRLPLSGTNTLVPVDVEGRPPAPDGQANSVDRRVTTPGYFRLMGIPLEAGRDFTPQDGVTAPLVAVVNEQMARQYWAGEQPIGRRVRLSLLSGAGPWLTVVGVIGNVRHHGLDTPVSPEIYVPYAQAPVESMTVVMQTRTDPEQLLGAVRARVWAVDPDQPVPALDTLAGVVSDSVATPRFRTLLVATFAGLALLLAALGIYGVVSYSVSRRTRDIGVRIALGAGRPAIVRMVVGEGLALALAGVAVGLCLALAATRVLASLLFDVTATDPLTYAAVAAVLVGVAGLASYLPARRAMRIDPIEALRAE
ncbi:MAG: ABC transporter permease [Acidobacteriota bacterium]|nr:ABC transporter permease [Acidobacteriota bacterium]